MNSSEFLSFLSSNNPNKPFRVILGMKTIQKLPVSIFDGKIVKYSRGVYWINFHLTPEKWYKGDKKNYFHPPTPEYCPDGENENRWWGRGEYPVFEHKDTGKKYLGLMEDITEESDKTYFVVRADEKTGIIDELPLNKEEVEKHIKRQDWPEGEPVYFNLSVENITFVNILG
jgi:hypothetical protein